MSKETESNPESGSLDSHVGTLLKEALVSASRVESGLTPGSNPSHRSDIAGTLPGQTIDTAPQASGQPGAATDHTTNAEIGQLDDDLAALTESLILGETISPPNAAGGRPGVEANGTAPGHATSTTVVAPPPASIGAGTTTAGPAPSAQNGTQGTPDVPQDQPATRASPSQPAQVGTSRPLHPVHVPAKSDFTPTAAALPIRAARTVGPIARAGLAAMSAPLSGRPRIIRDTVGWFAMWTMFLAACVWAYLLFVHQPATPGANTPPIGLVTDDRPPAAPEAGPPASEPGADPRTSEPKPAANANAAEHH